MMTEQIFMLLFSLVGGMALGGFYFGGLWFTLTRLTRVQHPGLWITASLVVRMALVIGGLYWLFDGQWQRLLTAMLGFLLVRFVMVRHIRPDSNRIGAATQMHR
jgi:F1F0 ATPase subunit 2